MGYNTACIILNDALDQIRTDPEVGKSISTAVMTAHRLKGDIRAGNHVNAMTVLPAQHADVEQIIIVGRNYIRPLVNCYRLPHNVPIEEVQYAVLKELADHLGYHLRKKK